MQCWQGRELDCLRATFRTTRGGENSSLLAVQQELLARIRANQNSANETAFAIVCVMPYRRDMY